MTSWLHEQRLDAAYRVVVESGARRILDLGCGDGDLMMRLVDTPHIERIVGIDLCRASLARLAERLAQNAHARVGADRISDVRLVHGSMLVAPHRYPGFDCAVLIETIEHVDPDRLSALERAVFLGASPACVVVTTPNADFNPLLGVPAGRFRHRDHRFEWGRDKFRRWAEGVASRTGYAASLSDVAGHHPILGGASQMAVFRERAGAPAIIPDNPAGAPIL